MDIQALLGADADSLLGYSTPAVPKESLVLPGPDFVDRVFAQSDRNPQVLRNLQPLFDSGRLGGSGYVSILPVDQGIEHSAAASFAPNPAYFDPINIVELAIEGGCNAVASTFGVLGMASRAYAHKIPFIVKINHNELLTYPATYDQIMFGSVEQACDLGAAGVGATIYFGSDESNAPDPGGRRGVRDGSRARHVHGAVVLRAQPGFTVDGVNYEGSADLTGQANHIGVTIHADIIKQKQPENEQRLRCRRLRQDPPAGLRGADDRPPD